MKSGTRIPKQTDRIWPHFGFRIFALDLHLSSPRVDARVLRDRQAAYSHTADNRAAVLRPFAAARLLGQVYDGGSMPSGPNLFYLTHPVQVTGAVTEGTAATMTTDSSTTVPVLVLRGSPLVGDYLTAYSVGGRWVSERGASSGGGSVSCTPCSIPTTNLTVSWVNILSGNGSDTLVYSSGGSPIWKSACSGPGGQNIFNLECASGVITLQVFYFSSGSCPSGSSSSCSNALASPHQLVLSSSTCSPFSVTFTCGAACSFLDAAGFTSFTITP
jgi:hypothetical protein